MSMHPTGLWGMWCFNALSVEQREHVVEEGYLPIGWRPDQTDCDRGAEIEIETMYDEFPGPRFYCIRCARQFLGELIERPDYDERRPG